MSAQINEMKMETPVTTFASATRNKGGVRGGAQRVARGRPRMAMDILQIFLHLRTKFLK